MQLSPAAVLGVAEQLLDTAQEMLPILYELLRDDQPYGDPDKDDEKPFDARNAPRQQGCRRGTNS